MFTGIITGVGRIAAVDALGSSSAHGKHLSVVCPPQYLDDVGLGDSIALNGACMTVTRIDLAQRALGFDVSAESLDKTAGLDQTGQVNLEKALRAHERLGGHIVAGHVDGVGAVTHFAQVGESWELRVLAPRALARYLATKGSITVNGVSLTVNRVVDLDAGTEISINLIPHTVQNTALGTLAVGSRVNLEIDLIARYVERMLAHPINPSQNGDNPISARPEPFGSAQDRPVEGSVGFDRLSPNGSHLSPNGSHLSPNGSHLSPDGVMIGGTLNSNSAAAQAFKGQA